MMWGMANWPIEFNSPIEFVLVGQFGRERGVLVQSKDAKLDLVAYAQSPRPLMAERPSILTVFLESQPMAINSPPVAIPPSSQEADHRSWALTFVWRATGHRQDNSIRELLEESLGKHMPDLEDAIATGSASRIGPAIAELVGICAAHRRRVIRRRRWTLVGLAVYLAAFIGFMALL